MASLRVNLERVTHEDVLQILLSEHDHFHHHGSAFILLCDGLFGGVFCNKAELS